MAAHNEFGKRGEQMAEAWLLQKGYAILHRNWRHGHYEIDLIARKGEKLHFVEVKARSSQQFGFPEEKVNRKKFQCLLRAADAFLYRHPQFRHVQYDILAITTRGEEAEFFLIEDVYL
ncbi:YraN family protein [Paraflavisolibacter sp. H34]|uniref:YraN family protein n=1 Tax=Huijunlia imazamoxiresistens TaxID=3127457 RepID=UPI003017307A